MNKVELKPFVVTVPVEYDHAAQLARFAKDYQGYGSWSKHLTNENFLNKIPRQFEPGKTYTVKILSLKEVGIHTVDEGYIFLERSDAILAGVEGILLVWQEARKHLPISKPLISLGKQEDLVCDDGSRAIPTLLLLSEVNCLFDLGSFADGCILADSLLYFHN